MRYINEKIIKECYHNCIFFSTDVDGMKCTHPFFSDKQPYDNMIITIENSTNGNIPEKCPLRKDKVEVVLRVKLDDKV